MKKKFAIYTGDTGDLRTSETFYNFKWLEPDCKIIFSSTQRGKAAICHFTSDKAGLKKLEQAINEWCEFCFDLFPWCKMVVGIIERLSVAKLAEKCGFKCVASFGNKKIFIRRP